jgi:hypothetical protein
VITDIDQAVDADHRPRVLGPPPGHDRHQRHEGFELLERASGQRVHGGLLGPLDDRRNRAIHVRDQPSPRLAEQTRDLVGQRLRFVVNFLWLRHDLARV